MGAGVVTGEITTRAYRALLPPGALDGSREPEPPPDSGGPGHDIDWSALNREISGG